MLRTLVSIACFVLSGGLRLAGQTGSVKLDQWIKSSGASHVIVDFFSSTCITCFKEMPKVNQLQKKFEGNLVFLLVGREDGRIQTTYNRFKEKFGLELQVLFDSLIQKEINVTEYPSYLWIENGKILAKSYNYAVTEENINDFLEGRLRKDKVSKKLSKFNLYETWNEKDNHAGAGAQLLQSALMLATDSTPFFSPPSIYKSPVPGTFQAINVTGESLYNYAYFGMGHWTVFDSLYGKASAKAILHIKDPDKLLKQMYCYYMTVATLSLEPEMIQRKLKDDLFTYFGYEVEVETRDMPCLRLVAMPDAKRLLMTKLPHKKSWVTHAGFAYYNSGIRKVIRLLGTQLAVDTPIVDDTNIDYPIDISIDGVLMDLDQVRKGLQRAGLDLIQSTIQLKVLVIRERDAATNATASSDNKK